MHQAFDQAVASIVRETQSGDGIEGVALLRSASAVATLNFRNAFCASGFGDAAFGLELQVESAARPDFEDLIAHREQGFIAGGIANLGEGHQRPMRAPPFGVYILFLNEPLIPAGEQCFRAQRISDFFLKVSNFPRMWILAENASPYFPANRRFFTVEERVDYETSISLHDRLLPRSMHNTTVTDSLPEEI